MKSAIRVFALLVVLVGGVSATVSPRTAKVTVSHQSASAAMPIPFCYPGYPCQMSGAER